MIGLPQVRPERFFSFLDRINKDIKSLLFYTPVNVVLNVVDSLILEKISCCDNDRRIYAFQNHLNIEHNNGVSLAHSKSIAR